MLTLAALLLVTPLSVLIGAVLAWLYLTQADRRQLSVIGQQLRAEQYIDAHTRATLQAMRDAARTAVPPGN